MAMPQDVAALVAALPDRTLILHHVEPQYQHLDYTWGLDAHQRIYPTVIKVLREAAANATGSSGGGGGCGGGSDSSSGGRSGGDSSSGGDTLQGPAAVAQF
jgi:hypothetical protein